MQAILPYKNQFKTYKSFIFISIVSKCCTLPVLPQFPIPQSFSSLYLCKFHVKVPAIVSSEDLFAELPLSTLTLHLGSFITLFQICTIQESLPTYTLCFRELCLQTSTIILCSKSFKCNKVSKKLNTSTRTLGPHKTIKV